MDAFGKYIQLPLFELEQQFLAAKSEHNDEKAKKLLTNRTYAFAFDLFVIFFISKGLTYSYYAFISKFLYQMPAQAQYNFFNLYEDFYLSIYVLTYFGYFFASLTTTHGQTPGKILFGLKVVNSDHTTTGPKVMQYLIRSLSYLTCHLGGLIWLAIPYFSKDKRGIPDWFSQTTVKTEKEYAVWLNKMRIHDQSVHDWNALQLDFLDQINVYKLPAVPEFLQDEDNKDAA